MSDYSFYDSANGAFYRHGYQGPDAFLAMNTPPGHRALAGVFDRLSQRVDVATGQVVDYVPDKPEDTDAASYSWNTSTKRWEAAPTLAALKTQANTAIDAAAGAARLRYITDTAGQQGVYLQKAAEAAAFKAADYADPVPPYIAAESGATGKTPQQAADGILAIAQQWGEVLSPAIERIRIGGKQAVDEAADAAAVEAARTAAVAALESV